MEKTVGSPLSAVQEMVQGPPDVVFWEVIAKLESAEAKGRKKRTLERKGEKENGVLEERRCVPEGDGGMH
jgi:hypothetical protein